MNYPLPGNPVRGSKTGKPIMALLDLLGRTWALGVIWHLSKQVLTFREIQSLCDGISPSLLNTRIKELRAANIVEKTPKGYALTEIGHNLFLLISPMGNWAINWQKELKQMKGQINE